ncbi:sensor histidine kinase [Lichenicoccus sp.]|uniref:sensor histidine kinase n=1 Tax=Lichenicoccus sp. TaxID=2781899 RepID=UPI003D0E8D8A
MMARPSLGGFRLGRTVRSASLRLAIVYAALFAISATLFLSFIWWATIGLLERQVEAAINADAQALSERWQEGGLPTLALTIQDRLEQNVDDDAIYLMVDGSGLRVAGNLRAWPRDVTRVDAWYQLPIARAGTRGLAEVHAFALPGNYRLLVGRDVRARVILKRLLTDTLLWALVMVAALGTTGGFLLRGLFRRMVRDIARTTAAISQGDLSRRVPLSGSGDEFDRVAETINAMLDRIGRLMDGVKQVSNAIAHDLRTPITRARSRLEDAALHASTTEELRHAVERAVVDLDGITTVFEALLRISEIEAGSRRSAFARIDLAPLLSDLAELYGALAEDAQLALSLSVPAPLMLWGDRLLIQQAVANLLDNAVKFSRPGGTVRLQAGIDAEQVHIAVADQGIGMAQTDRARAPDRFFRAEAARSTPGSGLGLSLVQAVAHLHGGTLLLEDAAPGLRAILALPTMPRDTQPRLAAPHADRVTAASSGDHDPVKSAALS